MTSKEDTILYSAEEEEVGRMPSPPPAPRPAPPPPGEGKRRRRRSRRQSRGGPTGDPLQEEVGGTTTTCWRGKQVRKYIF